MLSQDVAGVGGGVNYIRSNASAAKYWGLGRSGFIFSTSLEGGFITGWNGDDVRLTALSPRQLKRMQPAGS